MNGWNSKHQEITLAKGDPIQIKQLIARFKLEEIVFFDESEGLIITTIQHDEYIRLSDLLSLNIINKVIAFTLTQYLQIIIQLFEVLKQMEIQQIAHGNLKMENILLDLTQSKNKLGNKPSAITFEIRLINFAQFYNQTMEDDFQRAYTIYSSISSYFPNSKKGLNLCSQNDGRDDELFLETMRQLINQSGDSLQKSQERYSWDSQFFPKFLQNYKQTVEFPNYLEEIKGEIQQLHEYYLIVNHYPTLNISPLNIFTKQFKYQSEPYNFVKACSELNQIIYQIQFNQETITNRLQKINRLVQEYMTIQTYQELTLKEFMLYLRKQGYFENIYTFGEIIENVDQISRFEKDQLTTSLAKHQNLNYFQNQLLESYSQSKINLNTIFLEKIQAFESNSKDLEFKVYMNYVGQIEDFLIDLLFNIKLIGQRYSQQLVDFCIDIYIGRKQRELNLVNTDKLIEIIVDNWLKWIDQFIVDNQINQFKQLSQIGNECFSFFIQQKGFKILQVEMKNIIEQFLQSLFNRCHNNPLIGEQIEYIKSVVQMNYQDNYICVKEALCNQLIVELCQYIDQNQDINAQIKQINENLENIAGECIQTIYEQYKTEIQIADNSYNDQWQKIQHTYSSQPFIQFKQYNCQFTEYEKKNRIQYLHQINFEPPQQQQQQFQNYCLGVFNYLFNGPIQGLQTLNLELLNNHAKSAQNNASKKYQSMLQRLKQQYGNDFALVNWGEIEKIVFARLYNEWREGMQNHQMDELLNLQIYEQLIQSNTKDYIVQASLQGHNYLFDEEYHMINQNVQAKEFENLAGSSLSSQLYLEVVHTLKTDQLIEGMKKILRDKLKSFDLVRREFTDKSVFYGQVIKIFFDKIRSSVWEDEGHCSFYKLLAHCSPSKNLTLKLSEYFPQNPGQAKQLILSVQKKYDSVLTWIRNQFKKYISDEYQKVIDENDQLFLEIVHPPNSIDLDQDQIAYLEKQIDNYQKARYLEWLNSRWNKYKEETQKHENIDEDKWKISFYALQSEIEQSISNKLSQLDLEQSLEAQFRKQWIRNCEPKVIVAFVDISEEWE